METNLLTGTTTSHSETYTCHQCGRMGSVDVPDEFRAKHNLAYWLSILVCNRCADFLTARRVLREKIVRLALKRGRMVDADLPAEKLVKVTADLENSLHNLRELVATHWRREAVHESLWREAIERAPDRTFLLLDRMEKAMSG